MIISWNSSVQLFKLCVFFFHQSRRDPEGCGVQDTIHSQQFHHQRQRVSTSLHLWSHLCHNQLHYTRNKILTVVFTLDSLRGNTRKSRKDTHNIKLIFVLPQRIDQRKYSVLYRILERILNTLEALQSLLKHQRTAWLPEQPCPVTILWTVFLMHLKLNSSISFFLSSCSLLPPQFPQEKPVVSVYPPVGHHLVDSNNGTMITSPLISNVRSPPGSKTVLLF